MKLNSFKPPLVEEQESLSNQMKPKYTKEGLPVVSEANYKSLVHILQKEMRHKFFGDDFSEKLKKENSFIHSALDAVLREYGECDYPDGVAFGIMFTYELLRRQGGANQLDRVLDAIQYTRSGLPHIAAEGVAAFGQKMSQKELVDDPSLLQKILSDDGQNSHVYEVFRALLDHSRNKDERRTINNIIFGAYVMYAFLKRQGGANQLEKSIEK